MHRAHLCVLSTLVFNLSCICVLFMVFNGLFSWQFVAAEDMAADTPEVTWDMAAEEVTIGMTIP